MSFEKLENRYILKCGLRSSASIHVGTGVASSETDSPTIRQGKVAFVPGSSLRGALRSTVERIARTLDPADRLRFCVTFEDGPLDGCIGGHPDLRKQYESYSGRELNGLLTPGRPESLHLCAICRLFGSTLMAARLKVTDAVQSQEPFHKPVVRDGVGINRDTETAQAKIKYDYEVIEPRCDLSFSLQLENAARSDFALLYILLGELKRGIDVGGMRARGLGRVELTGRPSIEYFDEGDGYPVRKFLDDGYAPYTADFAKKLKRDFESYFEPEGQPHVDAGH